MHIIDDLTLTPLHPESVLFQYQKPVLDPSNAVFLSALFFSVVAIDEELNGTDLVAVWKTENQSAELKKFIDYMMNYFPAD